MIAVPPPQLRQLTVFDRAGKVVSTVGQPGLYVQPNLSPDGKRVVLMRNDPQTGNVDIWTSIWRPATATPITNDTPPENAPIWSPDGKQVAYVSTRGSFAGIYRKAADGTGEEELLFRYTPGAGMVLTDWSPDGKFLTFYTGVLRARADRHAESRVERKEIDWLREDYDVVQGRFSPDNRFIAFLSNEADVERLQVYVRPFDPNKPDAPAAGPAVQVSKDGAIGMIFWRQDGKEMYFMNRDWEVMAVDVTTTPTFQAGTPSCCSSCRVRCRETRRSGRTSARTASDSSSRCRWRPPPRGSRPSATPSMRAAPTGAPAPASYPVLPTDRRPMR